MEKTLSTCEALDALWAVAYWEARAAEQCQAPLGRGPVAILTGASAEQCERGEAAWRALAPLLATANGRGFASLYGGATALALAPSRLDGAPRWAVCWPSPSATFSWAGLVIGRDNGGFMGLWTSEPTEKAAQRAAKRLAS